MSKELKALKRIENFMSKNAVHWKQDIAMIETALKNYEELTSKPVIMYGRTHGHTKALIDTICKNYKEVKITNLEDEKKLKALEIIKEIMPIEEEDFCYDKETDTYFFIGYRVSKKQYDLLKEVLLCK